MPLLESILLDPMPIWQATAGGIKSGALGSFHHPSHPSPTIASDAGSASSASSLYTLVITILLLKGQASTVSYNCCLIENIYSAVSLSRIYDNT